MALDKAPATNLITVQTVYDLASDIGEHFKKLIEQHGQEANQQLIPSVVRVLEYLEEAVIQREDYLLLVDKLHRQIEDLQRGQHERSQQQQKYFSEIEDIDESWKSLEESWRKENVELSQRVKLLRNENKRLASSVNDKCSHSLSDLNQEEEDDQLRKSCLVNEEKLKRRISLLCKDIDLKKDEIDTLKSQNETLTEKNQNLRNLIATIRSNSMKSYNDIVVQETDRNDEQDRSMLENKIRALEEEVEMYKMRLKLDECQLETATEADNESLLNDRNNNSEPEETIKMEDLPVQGPLPKEPDEKMFWNRERKSRIWSFFPRLTRALIK